LMMLIGAVTIIKAAVYWMLLKASWASHQKNNRKKNLKY